MIAPLLYAATAALALWLTHRFLAPLTGRVALLLALLPLLFTGPALLTGQIYAPVDLPFSAPPLEAVAEEHGITRIHNGTLADVYTQIIPWKKAVRDAWRSGEWPLWNPYMFAGDILAGSAQAAPFEPFFLISLLAPMATSLTYHATVILFLGGLLMFAWLRELECRDEASLLGAAAWMFGDFMVFWLEWPLGATYRWMPLVFLGVRRIVRARSPKAIAILAIAFALMILEGHPESVLHIVVLGAAWGLWELWVVAPRDLWRTIGRAVLAGVLALAATAIFLLPIVEAIPQTIQHEQRSGMTGDRSYPVAVAAGQLLANVVPYRFGWAKDREVAEGADVHPVPWSSYPGSLVFPIAIYGLWRARHRERWPMLGLLLFGLLAGVNAPPVADLLGHLPLFSAPPRRSSSRSCSATASRPASSRARRRSFSSRCSWRSRSSRPSPRRGSLCRSSSSFSSGSGRSRSATNTRLSRPARSIPSSRGSTSCAPAIRSTGWWGSTTRSCRRERRCTACRTCAAIRR